MHLEGKKHMLELLQGIDGAFRPGVLTSLMVRPASHAFLQLLARAHSGLPSLCLSRWALLHMHPCVCCICCRMSCQCL